MNERIKELLDQATEVYDYWYRGESVCMVDHKMFAELIIRECLEKIYSVTIDNPTDDWDQGYDSGLDQAAETIKTHFGVKE